MVPSDLLKNGPTENCTKGIPGMVIRHAGKLRTGQGYDGQDLDEILQIFIIVDQTQTFTEEYHQLKEGEPKQVAFNEDLVPERFPGPVRYIIVRWRVFRIKS